MRHGSSKIYDNFTGPLSGYFLKTANTCFLKWQRGEEINIMSIYRLPEKKFRKEESELVDHIESNLNIVMPQVAAIL